MPAVPGGRPARPAGCWPTRPGRRPPPGTPRPLLPAFPSGRARPPARPRPAAGPCVIAAHSPGWPIARAPWDGSPGLAGCAGGGLDGVGGGERASSRIHGRAAPGNAHRSRPARRHPAGCTRDRGGPVADDRGGDHRAAGVAGRVLPLAPGRSRPAGGAAARRRGAGPAQRTDLVAAPPGSRHARETGAHSRWIATTSGSGTSSG